MINDHQYIRMYYNIIVHSMKEQDGSIYRFNKIHKFLNSACVKISDTIFDFFNITFCLDTMEDTIRGRIHRYVLEFNFNDPDYDKFCDGLIGIYNDIKR